MPPTKTATRLRLGAHMSIAGGLHKALERGAEAGCDVVQVFTKPNKRWAAKPLTDDDVERWSAARRATGVEPAMAHASYLINVASPDRELWRRSLDALAVEYRRCGQLRIPNLVFHPGAHMGRGEAEGIERIARAVRQILDEQPDNPSRILFENMAGQGTCVGHRFEHLRDLLDQTGSPARVGMCLDTCHTLAAGYDITSPGAWQQTLDDLERVVGCREVHAIHVNDSKRELGSRVDRHEDLGRGHLGLSGLRCLLNDPRVNSAPMALETPKTTDHSDAINLAVLRALSGRRRVGSRARRLAEQPLDRAPGS